MIINVPKWEDISTGSGWTFRCLVPILKSTACVACVLSTVLRVAILVGMAGLLVLIPIALDIMMLTACPKCICRSLGSLCFVPMWVQWTFFKVLLPWKPAACCWVLTAFSNVFYSGEANVVLALVQIIKKQIRLKLW